MQAHDGNQIGDAGAKKLSAALKSNTALTCGLKLGANPIKNKRTERKIEQALARRGSNNAGRVG